MLNRLARSSGVGGNAELRGERSERKKAKGTRLENGEVTTCVVTAKMGGGRIPGGGKPTWEWGGVSPLDKRHPGVGSFSMGN